MIQTRMRVGSNGPPIHLFDAESIRIYWRANGHRLAQKIDPQADPNSKVVKRIRKEQNENYTSNIFTKTSKQIHAILIFNFKHLILFTLYMQCHACLDFKILEL